MGITELDHVVIWTLLDKHEFKYPDNIKVHGLICKIDAIFMSFHRDDQDEQDRMANLKQSNRHVKRK
jgi:hypothetical protein